MDVVEEALLYVVVESKASSYAVEVVLNSSSLVKQRAVRCCWSTPARVSREADCGSDSSRLQQMGDEESKMQEVG